MHENVPNEVKWLVHEYLPTIEHVDVLLSLVRHTGAPRTIEDIVSDVSIHRDLVAQRLKDLIASRLVTVEPRETMPGGRLYRFVAPDDLTQHAVQVLLATYTTRPVSLIRFVYERPPESVQQFANAFRLRKPKP